MSEGVAPQSPKDTVAAVVAPDERRGKHRCVNRIRVFVYGSLKRGHVHHDEMFGADFEGVGTTRPGYALFRFGDYPAMVAVGVGAVVGELYAVDRDHLARLDEFEDCPRLYQRRAVELSDGSLAEAYTVTGDRVRAHEVIEGGWWKGG